MRGVTVLVALGLLSCGGGHKPVTDSGDSPGVSGSCVELDIDKLKVSFDSPKGGKQVVHVDPRGDFPKGTDLDWSVEGERVEVLSHSVKGGKALETKLDIGSLDPGDTAILTVSVSGRCDKALVVFREHLDLCMQEGGLALMEYEDAACGP